MLGPLQSVCSRKMLRVTPDSHDSHQRWVDGGRSDPHRGVSWRALLYLGLAGGFFTSPHSFDPRSYTDVCAVGHRGCTEGNFWPVATKSGFLVILIVL